MCVLGPLGALDPPSNLGTLSPALASAIHPSYTWTCVDLSTCRDVCSDDPCTQTRPAPTGGTPSLAPLLGHWGGGGRWRGSGRQGQAAGPVAVVGTYKRREPSALPDAAWVSSVSCRIAPRVRCGTGVRSTCLHAQGCWSAWPSDRAYALGTVPLRSPGALGVTGRGGGHTHGCLGDFWRRCSVALEVGLQVL